MKRFSGGLWLPVLCWGLLMLQAAESGASSVRLSYGFRPGAVYRVTEKHHDVGKTVTEMTVMGQPRTFENATDQVSSSTWTAEVIGREGKNVKLDVEYGQHKGGQRWSADKIQSDDMFAGSGAAVVIHPRKGFLRSEIRPEGDPTIELIYKARFAWLPALPENALREGDSFTHEYVLKSGIYNVKVTDEYYLAEVEGNVAIFDVETRQLMLIKMDQGPGGAGAMQGMALADMKLAYKGEGTAVFDTIEGIFIEREGRMSYSNLDSSEGQASGMSFTTRMEGVARYSWEMERE